VQRFKGWERIVALSVNFSHLLSKVRGQSIHHAGNTADVVVSGTNERDEGF
jgi:hypothetical protein